MSKEVLPFISNEVAESFAAFDDDVLAYVLRLWDCDAQDWSDDHMIVFRFENDDLLVNAWITENSENVKVKEIVFNNKCN